MSVDSRSLDPYRLPDRLGRLASAGATVTAVAAALAGLAFLTNPTPTQDLPGIGLPVTLPLTQPRLGHSAASYLVGMWVLEFTLPLALLAAYDRWAHTPVTSRRILLGVPAVYMLALSVYCRVVYVPTVTPTPLGPAATALCWAYCATGVGVWSTAALVVSGLGLLAWVAAAREWRSRGLVAVLFGVLSLPLGVPAIYWGYTRYSRPNSA